MVERHEARSDYFAAIRRRFGQFVYEVAAGLDALTRVQFDSPWQQPEAQNTGRVTHR